MKMNRIAGLGLGLLFTGLMTSTQAMAAGDTTVSGKLYTDFSVRSTDGNNSDDGYGLDVKRFYFGAAHKFDDTWSANLTTDFHYNSTDGRTSLFVKKAYVQAKLGDMATLRVGSADLPWVPYVEGVYGMRYVENVMIDRTGFGTSADWGIHLMGKNNQFDYQVSLVNGNGYKNPDRSKSMDVSARLGFHPIDGVTLAAGFRTGKLGQDTEGANLANTARRADLLAAWQVEDLTVGLEYFKANNFSKAAVITGPEDTASGVSGFASYALNDTGKLFARFEEVKPSKDLIPTMKNTYTNVGYAFSPRKGVDVAFVYKNTDAKVAGTSTKTNEFGVWAQVKF